MYDKDDHFGRWVQFVCAIPLLLVGGGLLYLVFRVNQSPQFVYFGSYRLGGAAVICLTFAGRFLWYAATGRNNINNKDL